MLTDSANNWPIALAVCVLMALAQFVPVMVRGTDRRALRTTLDSALIVGAIFILPGSWLAVAATLGAAVGIALRRGPFLQLAAKLSVSIIPMWAAVGAASLIDNGNLQLRPELFLASGLAALIYDAGNLLLLLLATRRGRAQQPTSIARTVHDAIPYWPALLALGWLAGLLAVRLPEALLLLTGPLMFVVLAAWAQAESARDRATMNGLLDLATNVSGLSLEEVKNALTATAASLMDAPQARIGLPPHDGEIGVPLSLATSAPGQWLCVAPRRGDRDYAESDLVALKRIAAIGARALDTASQNEWISQAAEYDVLTDLFNRRAFEAILERALWEDAANTMLLFIDLDGFKQVNDRHGHDAGDEVLIDTARRLRTAVRRNDAIARVGGDEFTIVMRGAGEKNAAIELAERVLAVFGPPFSLSSGEYVRLSPSIGIAMARQGSTAAELLRAADSAMYAAKRAGKNCWRELEVA